MDLRHWLRGLGLEQYAAIFRENAIDDAVLPSLTAEDLKDLRVGIVEHRRKLLDAIAALRANANVKAPTPAAPGTTDRPPDLTAERRQVTVMFSDLVDSTALSAHMDPEDLREIISAYQKCAAEIVRRFGGYVAQYSGDGVLVYFGYPQAHEDDAERAIRAGLELTGTLGGLKTRASLQTRVGIATGLVVVGDLMDSGNATERGIGETLNLAERLQELAEPNMLVIAESTRKLVGILFELQDLRARELKGIVGPVQCWAVLRASSVASRFEALHPTGLTALVGRDKEFELLRRCWLKATDGEGQVVLLSGEAGIGKSRLTTAFVELLAGEPHICLRYFSSPQHSDSALYPIIGQIERAAGLVRGEILQAKLDKLDGLLKHTSTCAQDSALFAEMLSLPNDGRYPAVELTPQQRRQRTLDALIRQMEALSSSAPVLMVFEDAHWADPTSLELLGRTVSKVASYRMLLIVTFRPEFEPGWIGSAHATGLSLNPLASCEVGALIDHIVGNNVLPVNIRQEIIERTDGIPLFVEEMTKAVLEAECQDGAERTAALVPSPPLAVPVSLHASLMARLDRLGPAKELAQIGAAIGREFSHSLLAAVACKPEAKLRTALDRLLGAGLVLRQGGRSQSDYFFKHALVRDAAYSTLLREPRRALHAKIAETLESQFAEISENQPELLARHWTEAGQIERAAALWGKAGQRSLQRSALVEAAEQLRRALDQVATLTATPALRREEIKLQVALINTLFQVKGYAAPETKAAVERARLLVEQAEVLGEPLEDPLLLFSVLFGLWVANLNAINGDVMRELAARFLTLGERQGTTAPLMIGHRIMGTTLLFTGDIVGALAHYNQSLGIYGAEHRPLATRFGTDSRVTILAFRALVLWLLGYPAAALADADHALKEAREIDQAATLMFALARTSYTHIFCGNYTAVTALLDELVALADSKSVLTRKAEGMILQGCVSAVSGKPSDAVRMITSWLTAWRSTGATICQPLYLSYLAIAHANVSQFDDAWGSIGEVAALLETTKEVWCAAEIHRIAGEIALTSPKPNAAKAESYFERALAVARKQEAKSWELRAAMSMARLWADQGKRAEARNLLASVHGWFSEGFGTHDLREAKALLDTLASSARASISPTARLIA
jgi:class 3 adenylate cyclase/predicted ATPase